MFQRIGHEVRCRCRIPCVPTIRIKGRHTMTTPVGSHTRSFCTPPDYLKEETSNHSGLTRALTRQTFGGQNLQESLGSRFGGTSWNESEVLRSPSPGRTERLGFLPTGYRLLMMCFPDALGLQCSTNSLTHRDLNLCSQRGSDARLCQKTPALIDSLPKNLGSAF